jgi:uncharacterized delta-60 repeat protein
MHIRSFTLLLLLIGVTPLAAAPTELDTSFDNDGIAQDYLDLGTSKTDLIADVAIAPTTGSIYSVGKSEFVSSGGATFGVLFKRQANGAKDSSFSNGVNNISRVYFPIERNGGSSGLTGVDFDNSNTGAVAVVGFNDLNNGQRCGVAYKVLDNAMVKGALDGGFGVSGRFSLCSGIGAVLTFSDVKVLSDGRLLITGNSSFASGEKNGFLLRLTANGQFDTTFNAGGISGYPGQISFDIRPGKDDSALRIAITPLGYYVAGNTVYTKSVDPVLFGDDVDVWVARVNTNGTLDSTFNGNGKRIEYVDLINSDKTDLLADLAVDSAGRVLLLGNINPAHVIYDASANVDPARSFRSFVAVVRLTSSGQRDTGFASGGRLLTTLGDHTCGSGQDFCSYDEPAAFTTTISNDIWIAGRFVPGYPSATVPRKLALGRVSNVGVLNLSQRILHGQNVEGVSLLRQADGKLVVGAQLRTTSAVTDVDFALIRMFGTP